MKRLALAAALLTLAAPASAGTQEYLGRWKTGTRGGVVEIVACGPSVCGRLVGSDRLNREPGLQDARNKDAGLRTRPLKGVTLLSGFKPDGAGWTGGRIYNPEDGNTYQSRLKLRDANTLEVKGCVTSILCKTQVWTRAG